MKRVDKKNRGVSFIHLPVYWTCTGEFIGLSYVDSCSNDPGLPWTMPWSLCNECKWVLDFELKKNAEEGFDML